MSRAAWVVATMAGLALTLSCAPGKPEKLEHPKQTAPYTPIEVAPPTVFVNRPSLQVPELVPDFHDELRWPLSSMSHPVLEPKFDIAAQFAQPGIGWTELCARGVQNRYGQDKELLSYLRGWCNAVKGDADAACANLAPLLGSTTAHLGRAVRTDLANILANGHLDKAQHLINVNHIRDVAMLDLLTANYVEVGTVDEALAMNRQAMDSDDYASDATKCIRWTRDVVLTNAKMSDLLQQVEQLATKPKLPDPKCVELHHKLKCWRDAGAACREYMQDQGWDQEIIDLNAAYYSWPTGNTSRHWLDIVDLARAAIPLSGANQILLAALENALRAGPCDKTTKEWIQGRVKDIRELLDAPDQERLDAIVGQCK